MDWGKSLPTGANIYLTWAVHTLESIHEKETLFRQEHHYVQMSLLASLKLGTFGLCLENWSPLIDFEMTEICDTQAIQTVHRMVYRPGREIIMGHLLIPLDGGLFEVRVVAIDDTTGFRESAIAMMQDNIEAMQKIAPKTYDAIEMDEIFPEHCLSRARWGLRAASRWISTVSLPATKLVNDRESRRRVAASELLALAKSVSRKQHEDSDCDG